MLVDLEEKTAPCLWLDEPEKSWPSLFLKDLLGLSHWLSKISDKDSKDSKSILKRYSERKENQENPVFQHLSKYFLCGFIHHHVVPVGIDLLKGPSFQQHQLIYYFNHCLNSIYLPKAGSPAALLPFMFRSCRVINVPRLCNLPNIRTKFRLNSAFPCMRNYRQRLNKGIFG